MWNMMCCLRCADACHPHISCIVCGRSLRLCTSPGCSLFAPRSLLCRLRQEAALSLLKAGRADGGFDRHRVQVPSLQLRHELGPLAPTRSLYVPAMRWGRSGAGWGRTVRARAGWGVHLTCAGGRSHSSLFAVRSSWADRRIQGGLVLAKVPWPTAASCKLSWYSHGRAMCSPNAT